MTMIIFVSAIPLQYAIDWIFENIIFAPTYHDLHQESESKSKGHLHELDSHPAAEESDETARKSIIQRMRRASDTVIETVAKLQNATLFSKVVTVPSKISYLRNMAKMSFKKSQTRKSSIAAAFDFSPSTTSFLDEDYSKNAMHEDDEESKMHTGREAANFINALTRYRDLISDPFELKKFDTEWSLEYVNDATSLMSYETKRKLEEDLRQVINTYTEKLEEFKSMSEAAEGCELLKLFFVDLLGRTSSQARILENNLNCYIIRDKRVVSWSIKCMTVTMLVCTNIFFLYSCLLYGNEKGRAWQNAWLLNSVVNILIEIFFNNVTEAIVISFAIPETIFIQATAVKQTIGAVIEEICDKLDTVDRNLLSVPIFSSTDYLFVSTRLAKKMPHLMESSIVLAYQTSFPEDLRRKPVDAAATVTESQDIVAVENNTVLAQSSQYGWKAETLAAICMGAITAFLQYVGSSPLSMQRLIMHIIQPMVLGAFGLLYTLVDKTTNSSVAACLIPMLACSIPLFAWIYNCNRCQCFLYPFLAITSFYLININCAKY
jgi:hypothetical protein